MFGNTEGPNTVMFVMEAVYVVLWVQLGGLMTSNSTIRLESTGRTFFMMSSCNFMSYTAWRCHLSKMHRRFVVCGEDNSHVMSRLG